MSEAGARDIAGGHSRLTTLLLIFSAAWCVAWFLHAFPYWEDDAWIHLEFARSFAAGKGFSFNGLLVYGDTSPLWVWLLDLSHAVLPAKILPDPYATAGWFSTGKVLAAAGCIFALTGGWFYARTLTRTLPAEQSHLFAAFAVATIVANPFFGYWAFSGMEAFTAAGLVCWGLALLIPAKSTPLRLLLAALAAGLAPLLRPEMSFFLLLMAGLLLIRWYALPLRPWAKGLLLVAVTGLLAGPGAGWAYYALHHFGSVIPTTNAAKKAGAGQSVMMHLVGVYSLGYPLILPGVLALSAWGLNRVVAKKGAGLVSLGRLLGAGGWLIFAWSALNAIFYVTNHTYVQTRYLIITAPILTIALLAIVALLWPRLYRAAAFCVLGIGILEALWMAWPLVGDKVIDDRLGAQFAAYVKTLPPDEGVAEFTIGQLAFLSRHTIIDTGGITRPAINAFGLDKTNARKYAWMYSEGARYIDSDRPDLPGTRLVYRLDGIYAVGWHLDPRSYREAGATELWTLPPSAAAGALK